MYALEQLMFRGTGCCPRYSWTQFAVCGNRALLKKIHNSQRHPERWRIVFMPCQIEDRMKNLQKIA